MGRGDQHSVGRNERERPGRVLGSPGMEGRGQAESLGVLGTREEKE